MSLTQLQSQIDDLRAQAASIQGRGTRTRDSVNNDRALSDVGKRKKLDQVAERTKDQLGDLRARENKLITDKRESLERQLFGLSSTASSDPQQLIAYRDAQDRATKLPDSNAAKALLASAAQSNDRTLAAAIVARALALIGPAGVLVSNGWRAVVDDYADRFPADTDKLTDLIELHNHRRDAVGTLFAYMPPL